MQVTIRDTMLDSFQSTVVLENLVMSLKETLMRHRWLVWADDDGWPAGSLPVAAGVAASASRDLFFLTWKSLFPRIKCKQAGLFQPWFQLMIELWPAFQGQSGLKSVTE